MEIADIMFHVHPDLSTEQRTKIEEGISADDGVVSVHFSPDQLHVLTIAYNPEKIKSATLLEQIRQWDKEAMMVGL